ncbi:MAG: hypothetical protein ABI193_02490 [Minicystis sp.]
MRPSTARFLAALSLASLSLTAAPQAFAQGAPPADPTKLEEAKRHMQAGASFYNDPNGHKCEEAIREFGKAFDLSGSLNALKGMAVCNLELERDGEAIEQYTKYLQGKGASIDPADKQQIEGDLNALKSAVAYINFVAPAGTWRLTDTRTPSRGFPITNRYQVGTSSKRLGIHPGQHTFTASIEGKADVVWQVEIVNGAKYDHTFEGEKAAPVVTPLPPKDLPPPPKDLPPPIKDEPTKTSRPIPVSAYITGGLTIAGIGATAGLGVRALGKESDYKSKNGSGTTSAGDLATLRDGVKGANLVTDIVMGVTAAAAVTTVVLIITRPSRPVKEAKNGTWTLAPSAGPTGGGAFLTGTF